MTEQLHVVKIYRVLGFLHKNSFLSGGTQTAVHTCSGSHSFATVCYLAKSNLYFANFSHCPMCTLTHGFLCAIWSILIFYSLSIDHDGLMMQLSWLFKQVFKIQGGPLRDVSSQVFDHVICQNCVQNYCAHNHSTPLLRVCVVGRELPTMIRQYKA